MAKGENTAHHFSAAKGHLEAFKALIAVGANPSFNNEEGQTVGKLASSMAYWIKGAIVMENQISIPDEKKEWVRQQIQTGHYPNEEAYIEDLIFHNHGSFYSVCHRWG